MKYRDVLRERMKSLGLSGAGLGRILGVGRMSVSTALSGYRMVKGKKQLNEMGVDTLLKYVDALGGKVYIEFPNEGDMRRRERYQITNEPVSVGDTEKKED